MNRYHLLTKPNVAKQNANFAEAVKLMLWEFHQSDPTNPRDMGLKTCWTCSFLVELWQRKTSIPWLVKAQRQLKSLDVRRMVW